MNSTLVSAAFLALTFSVPSFAGIEKMSDGGWWAVHGGKREDGAFVCALVSTTPEDANQKFVLEYVQGSQVMVARMLKPTWNMPSGTRSQVFLKFGYGEPVSLSATGSGTELRAEFPAGAVGEFLTHLKVGLTIGFRGSEPAWSLTKSGAGIVEPDFVRCLKMQMPERFKPATQPF